MPATATQARPNTVNAWAVAALGSTKPSARRLAATWWLLACYDGVLIGLGILGYVVGAVIFARRDLPAPL